MLLISRPRRDRRRRDQEHPDMYIKTSGRASNARRGVILMVILAMLTLFALIGITFVFYADSAASAARLRREAESTSRPEMDPELAFTMFLGQLLYDANDDESGVGSGLRGHSLARSMFGYNSNIQANGTIQVLNNTVAFNG